MAAGLEVAFFGSSLVSAYWNGAATYYRGIIRALARRGHRVTFYEPDAYDRQAHRDIPDPEWARVVVYSGTDEVDARRALERATAADLVVKASGVGVFDRMLEARVEQYVLRPAAVLPGRRFVLGGNGWHDKALPPNVAYVGHVYTRDHNAFNRSTLAVLNVNRDSMARFGFSPATRVFEAAGAA